MNDNLGSATTIKEVARLAGVSTATVSRYFSGAKVSPSRSKAVDDAATALSFVPNRAARTLRRRRSELIALVIPDIENPFFTSVARGVEDVTSQSGYSVVLCNTDDDPDKEARYLEIAISESMAGVVLVPTRDSIDLSTLIRHKRPIVTVDRRARDFAVDSVLVDNEATGRQATELLLARGYSRVACITGPIGVETAHARADAWSTAVREAGQVAMQEYVKFSDFRADGGYAAMKELLELTTPPDAVFVTNNLMALGALRALAEFGLSPASFGVAALGVFPFESHIEGISMVDLPAREVGKLAATMLMERLAGDYQPARSAVVSGGSAPSD